MRKGLVALTLSTLLVSASSPQVGYFAKLPASHINSSVTMTSSDFNKDGNPDLVVGVGEGSMGTAAVSLYFFEGDGKGNFKQRFYSR